MESGWNVWVWLVGVVNRRRVWLVGVFLVLLIPTFLVFVLFCSSIPILFVHFYKYNKCAFNNAYNILIEDVVQRSLYHRYTYNYS